MKMYWLGTNPDSHWYRLMVAAAAERVQRIGGLKCEIRFICKTLDYDTAEAIFERAMDCEELLSDARGRLLRGERFENGEWI